ncbi:aminoglycoside phosphotransferase family protein [Streptomyces armeniacus]|uniref:Aminoglycoside phosphotransferase family protein n=1 Tax=Streptomyces armeniacus TaxID=83291 RepID=A0A345XS92_9ACTN|nr:aminoglycoside phosphotransferase family protein [Streptomyces armeniacus]AXK34508.1 aminoglycoside phosphotransferase family protein [Streptomyces armeniacus]
MTSHAHAQAARLGVLEGPLRGYHREWYVVRSSGELAELGRLKVGEPREGVLWFDRRCFPSEEALLMELAGREVPRIPPVRRIGTDGPAIHGFVEGSTLAELAPSGRPVDRHHVDQIMELFRGLAGVRPGDLSLMPAGSEGGDGEAPVQDRDSAGFLTGLLRFTREHGYTRRRPEYGRLFDRLGVPAHAFDDASQLGVQAAQLTERPFCLLHGDLHRENFIVDPSDGLWTIDWELATIGDPLYDLATHLHLMHYPSEQEKEVVARWCGVMEEALPGATAALDPDLDRYLRFKRVQSVCTDVVRHAAAVRDARPARRAEQLGATATSVHRILLRAAEALGLPEVPSPGTVEEIYAALPPAGPRP